MMVFCASTPPSVVNRHCFVIVSGRKPLFGQEGEGGGGAMVVPTNVSGSVNFK